MKGVDVDEDVTNHYMYCCPNIAISHHNYCVIMRYVWHFKIANMTCQNGQAGFYNIRQLMRKFGSFYDRVLVAMMYDDVQGNLMRCHSYTIEATRE